jgi:hypothetical protein
MTPELPEVDTVQDLIQARIQKLTLIAAELPEYLRLIQAAANGEAVRREAVLRASELLMDNLYRGVLSPRMSVPRDFWGSSLGLMIARAHTHVVPDAEVVSQAEAAQLLGVSREYMSQLVESGKVSSIVREAAALRSRKQPREMLFRDNLEALKSQLRTHRRPS